MSVKNSCNPFSLSIAKGKDFCNRAKEKADLVQHARNGNNVVLISPRRAGKSSLVGEVIEQLKKDGMLTAYAELFSVISEKDFIKKLGSALIHDIGKGADPRTFINKAGEFFKMVQIGWENSPEGGRFYFKFAPEAKHEELLDDILGGLYAYVRKKKVRACVVLDEFQELTTLPEAKKIEGTLRAQMQQHKEISYFYVGSRRRVLQEMFSDRARPFYKSAFQYPLDTIPRDEFTQYIMDKFIISGKRCPKEAAERIYDLVRGYAYYVQKLSNIAWDLTDKELDIEIVRTTAYNELLRLEYNDFVNVWRGLTLNQKAVMRAISSNPTKAPYSRAFLKEHDLSLGGVQAALAVLLDRDIVEENNGLYRSSDPVIGVLACK